MKIKAVFGSVHLPTVLSSFSNFNFLPSASEIFGSGSFVHCESFGMLANYMSFVDPSAFLSIILANCKVHVIKYH